MDKQQKMMETYQNHYTSNVTLYLYLSFRMRISISLKKKTFAGFQVLWPTSTIIINHPYQPPSDEHEQN